MKNDVTVENILKFEKEHRLKEREIYGINYWYCRRTRTLNDIITIANNQQGICDKEKLKPIKLFSSLAPFKDIIS